MKRRSLLRYPNISSRSWWFSVSRDLRPADNAFVSILLNIQMHSSISVTSANITQAGIVIAFRRLFGAGEHLDENERLMNHTTLVLCHLYTLLD